MEQGDQIQEEKKKIYPSATISQKESEGNKETIVSCQEFEGEKKPVTSEREIEGEKESLSARVVSLLFGDVTVQTFENWVALVRNRSGKYRPSGFPNRLQKKETMTRSFLFSKECHDEIIEEQDLRGLDIDSDNTLNSDQYTEPSLWERLGNASILDIDSNDFSWVGLSSLHHTEHTSSMEHSEDEMNKPLEVNVNSGGVVFFALFNSLPGNDLFSKEAAAVIKIAPSRMATQSERLGYEFAKWLGVRTPQARVVHNTSPEWKMIKDATEKAREAAASFGDEFGEITCSELLEALEMSRCVLLMNYVHGSPLLESPNAFGSSEASRNTASSLGRILMLDLILRNEDRLPCRQLGWRGNPANLLLADKISSAKLDALEEANNMAAREKMINTLQAKRRAYSVNGSFENFEEYNNENKGDDFHIVAIDTGVPRRPPAGKRAKDQDRYPKVVELILNTSEYSANILHEISGGKLGYSDDSSVYSNSEMDAVVHEFRSGFRAALRDLQGFHLFILTLYQKLDGLLRVLSSIISKSSEESDKDDSASSDSPTYYNSPMAVIKERFSNDAHLDMNDIENHKSNAKAISHRGSPDTPSPVSRENWSGKYSKGSGEPSRGFRMTMKLRDFHKFAKDAELQKELEQWNEMVRTDVIKLCQDNNFNTGFFEGSDNNIAIDAYELKVRLEHVLERMSLILEAANTEKPSLVTGNLFIGGALVARSMHTLKHLGITHILCLCSNEIGQSDTQYPDVFEYKNFSISDSDDSNISDLFEEASNFIDEVEGFGGKVLVHCFEGKSRSATIVLAYLMSRKKLTLVEAWTKLKKVHRRAQPNDGFGKALIELDKKLNGKASMDWQHRRPTIKVCPICGKNAGLSTSSLKLHLQKSHKKSSGSVDSAMTMEIQKAVEDLKLSRSESDVVANRKHSRSHNLRSSY